ncbi:MAG: AlkA N-terminal domain-containing protein [Solirubrobacteraceae bacterium]
MIEDFDRCYQAAQSRDPRFDGWFFTAVTSTGIYCRPSCPALTPKRENVRFYPSAAAAQQAGFRACKRCRPDAAPGSPEWNVRADVVARAMRLIADGVVDRDGVPGLAAQLGYSSRQLQRLLVAELGAGPIAIARAQRAQTARVLIETTTLAMAEVAFAAGFQSVRQFNDTVRSVFSLTPSVLREKRKGARGSVLLSTNTLSLRLAFRKPLSPQNLFGHLAATAIPGVEEVRDGVYRRTLRLPHGPGVVELVPTLEHINCQVTLHDLRDLTTAIARCRWLLDLDADPHAIDELLARDPQLRPVIERARGRRVPRCVDGAEMAIRAVLGQQISTAAARTYAGRIATARGEEVEDHRGGLSRLFPTPTAIEGLELAMPTQRRRSLAALLAELSSERLSLDPGCDRAESLAALERLPGFGPWTTQIIAMRALGDPDAFPSTDLGVRRGAEALGLAHTQAAMTAHSQGWRPWRAYAVQYLWSCTPHSINQWPARGVGEELVEEAA